MKYDSSSDAIYWNKSPDSVLSYTTGISVRDNLVDIRCLKCINSVVKECVVCGSKKRYCLLLNIDVNDDFYCECWGEKTETING